MKIRMIDSSFNFDEDRKREKPILRIINTMLMYAWLVVSIIITGGVKCYEVGALRVINSFVHGPLFAGGASYVESPGNGGSGFACFT